MKYISIIMLVLSMITVRNNGQILPSVSPTRAPTPFCPSLEISVIDAVGFNETGFDGSYNLDNSISLNDRPYFVDPADQNDKNIQFIGDRYNNNGFWVISAEGSRQELTFGPTGTFYPPFGNVSKSYEWSHNMETGLFHILIQCLSSAPTIAPTTSIPTTAVPTTNTPTTSIPTTANPTTASPTDNPTTTSPTTAIPTTRFPTAGPTTAIPTTNTPTTAVPTTDNPTTASPTSNPTTAIPTTSIPTTAIPTNVPTTASPTTANPTTADPTTAVPTTAVPTTDTPTGSPTTANPTTAIPTTASPTIEPTTATPTTRIPTNVPTTANPTTADPTTARPTTSIPTTANPTTTLPTTSLPTTGTPTTSNPTTSNPTTAVPTTAIPTTAPTHFCAYLQVDVLDADGKFEESGFEGLYKFVDTELNGRPLFEVEPIPNNDKYIKYQGNQNNGYWVIAADGNAELLQLGPTKDIYPPYGSSSSSYEWTHNGVLGTFHVLIQCISSAPN